MKKVFLFACLLSVVLLPALQGNMVARAQAPTAYDLINGVNELRANNGLPPFEINSILMSIAQSHSDYQASIGSWTHTGPDGSRPVDRAMAAGYGGGQHIIVSENVAVVYEGQNYGISNIIYDMWSDALHWNTMVKPDYTHAGAGVTTVNGVSYYTLDVGYIAGQAGSSDNAPPPAPTEAGGSAAEEVVPTQVDEAEIIQGVKAATAMPDGSIIHTVAYGQALLLIADAYGVTVETLMALNGITADDIIYVGQELVVQPASTPTVLVASETPQQVAVILPVTSTPKPTITQVGLDAESGDLEPAEPPKASRLPSIQLDRLGLSIIIVVAVGLLAVIAVTIFNSRKDQ